MTATPSARRAGPEDWDYIYANVEEAIERAIDADKDWVHYADADVVVEYLMNSENSWIVEGYFIFFDIGKPWFGTQPFLYEELVLRLYGNAPFSVVTDFLTAKAKEHGCVMICAGTLLSRNDAALSRLYWRGGFTPTGITMTKETHVL